MECGFSGCKNTATHILKQTVGKKQELPVCDGCLPEWAKDGGSGSPFYTVRKINQ